jgi:hypothetical protein
MIIFYIHYVKTGIYYLCTSLFSATTKLLNQTYLHVYVDFLSYKLHQHST